MQEMKNNYNKIRSVCFKGSSQQDTEWLYGVMFALKN